MLKKQLLVVFLLLCVILPFTPQTAHAACNQSKLGFTLRHCNGHGTPEATPEATPDVTPEATPDSTPETTPEVTADPSATPSPTDDNGGGDPSATPTATDDDGGGDPTTTPTATDDDGGGNPSATPSATDDDGGGNPSATPTATDDNGGGNPTMTLTLPPTPEVVPIGVIPNKDNDGQVITINISDVALNSLPPLQGKYVTVDVVDGQARPTFYWGLAEGSAATWFNFALAEDNTLLVETWMRVEDVCEGTICQFTPGIEILPQDVLLNGTFQWWMYSWATDSVSTWESLSFDINVPQPTLPLIYVTLSEAQPTLSWTDDNNAAWFQVWIGTTDLVTVYMAWHTESELCDGVICNFTLPESLVQGSYDVYVQPWGAGGFNSNLNQGWAGPFNFRVAAPSLVTGMIVDNDKLLWNASVGATWYRIWVGSGAPDWTMAYFQWHEASVLGCAEVEICSLNIGGLASGDYVWFVQAYGPGGITNDGYNGWADGGDFSR